MKKIICLVLTLLLATLALTSCEWLDKLLGKGPEENLLPPATGMYYTPSGFSDTVFCIDRSKMNTSEFVTISSLQGILAQTQATIYITGDEGQSYARLEELSAKNGFDIQNVDDPWELIDLFFDVYQGTYVLYNDHSNSSTLVNDQTINYATTIAGAECWLMISKDIELTAKSHGLTLGCDTTDGTFNTRYVFETYKSKLNNSVLVHQDQTNNGGLEYDSVKWVASDSGGESAIRLDGSDLEDVLDPLPNAWIYNMFELSTDADKDNYLYCYIAGGTNADVNLRVRALYEENGVVNSVILDSEQYEEGRVNNYGWYKRTGASSEEFRFDISALKGKKVLISIEQDDTGDGSGEIVFVRQVSITGSEIVKISKFPNWGRKDIRDDWTVSGSVETHSEGVCLEAMVAPASISYTFVVTEDTKWAKFYVRMFVRADDPDTPPQLTFTVNGTTVRALNAPGDSVVANSDYYRCIAYDLSAYVGQEVTLTFTSLTGHHAAIGRIRLDSSCTTSEVTQLYNDNQVKEMK